MSVAFFILGFIVMGEALFRALRVSRSLDEGRLRSRVWYPVAVTCLAWLLGISVTLAVFLAEEWSQSTGSHTILVIPTHRA